MVKVTRVCVLSLFFGCASLLGSQQKTQIQLLGSQQKTQIQHMPSISLPVLNRCLHFSEVTMEDGLQLKAFCEGIVQGGYLGKVHFKDWPAEKNDLLARNGVRSFTDDSFNVPFASFRDVAPNPYVQVWFEWTRDELAKRKTEHYQQCAEKNSYKR